MKKAIFIIMAVCLFASCSHKSHTNEPDTEDKYDKIELQQNKEHRPTNPLPPVTPLDKGHKDSIQLRTELQEEEPVLTPLESSGNVEIVVPQAGADIY
jgi:hypothetical protein